MKPLIVLVAVFALVLGVRYAGGYPYDPRLAGRFAMCAMLVFTSIAHFAFNRGMAMMLPPSVPARKLIVYITGVMEVVLGICLLVPSLQVIAGWSIILFFVLLLPANIYAASNYVNYEKATRDGKGPGYLWLRVPMQLLFIAWVYLAAIY